MSNLLWPLNPNLYERALVTDIDIVEDEFYDEEKTLFENSGELFPKTIVFSAGSKFSKTTL